MRCSLVHLASLAAIGLVLAFAGAPASAKTVKECDAEYAANKGAIKGSGEKKKDFVDACRAGTESIPGGAATAPAAASAAEGAATTGFWWCQDGERMRCRIQGQQRCHQSKRREKERLRSGVSRRHGGNS